MATSKMATTTLPIGARDQLDLPNTSWTLPRYFLGAQNQFDLPDTSSTLPRSFPGARDQLDLPNTSWTLPRHFLGARDRLDLTLGRLRACTIANKESRAHQRRVTSPEVRVCR